MTTNALANQNASNSGNNLDSGRWSAWRIATWAFPGLILLVPLVAMQFTDEVKWGFFDFVIIGGLLYGARMTYEVVARKGGTTSYRAGVCIGVSTALILVWVNAAVGIIGDGPINLLYLGVIAVGMIGAVVARFQPLGMARALLAMAAAQMLVPVIALILNQPFAPGVAPVFILNGCFALVFVGSAGLFQYAARASSSHSAM